MILKKCLMVTLLVPYVIGGVALCRLARERIACKSSNYYPYWLGLSNVTLPAPEKILSEHFCAGDYHGVRALVGTLWAGFAIIIFRLLDGKRTKVIKYIHMCCHLVTICLLTYDYYKLLNLDRSIGSQLINFHGMCAKFVYGIFIAQVLMAFTIYVYLFDHCTIRCSYAPTHDIGGIWIYICLVACSVSGFSRSHVDYLPHIVPTALAISGGCFSIILLIVICPYFEWDMVSGVLVLVNSYCLLLIISSVVDFKRCLCWTRDLRNNRAWKSY